MFPPLYAHRLGRAYGPDSSAAALRGALTAGVEGLETDVCLTADGELVLLHDPYLPLGTGLEGFAHERTASDLRRTRLRDRDGRLTAESPLFLDDLLAATPVDVVLQLEVKAHADLALAGRTAGALAERLRGRMRGRRYEVLSFEAATCARAASLGCPARLVVWADYAPAALVRWARRHGVGGVCVEHFLLSPALMARLRRGGLSVTTGTLNQRVLLDRVLPLRPDAVTSDAPHALRDAPAAAPLAA
jgi:glycerophosphoryl diester phosphodiesterase